MASSHYRRSQQKDPGSPERGASGQDVGQVLFHYGCVSLDLLRVHHFEASSMVSHLLHLVHALFVHATLFHVQKGQVSLLHGRLLLLGQLVMHDSTGFLRSSSGTSCWVCLGCVDLCVSV